MLKLGYKASIKKTSFKNINWNDSYNVSANLTQLEPRIIISKQREEQLYTGVMWCPRVYDRPFITERNGKLGIHYNTQDSNKAVAQTQEAVYKRKAVRPMLEMLKYHIDKELISEWGELASESFEWKWDDYDLTEDIQRHTLLKMQLDMGIKTPEMIADDEGIDYTQVRAYKEEEDAKEMESMKLQQAFAFQGNNSDDGLKAGKKYENEFEKVMVEGLKDRAKEIEQAFDLYGKGPLSKIR